jgi:hypothetical protein
MTRLALLPILVLPALVSAQRAPCTTEARTFVAHTRQAIERYRDPDVAAADGYRRAGFDLPNMGEHWINLREVMSDSLTLSRPGILIYFRTPSGPKLAGAAFTALLDAGERPPGPPEAETHWHAHTGYFDDEMFSAHTVAEGTIEQFRLAALHVWTATPNRAGIFVAENWDLPYLRLGYLPPAKTSERATRALAFASTPLDYYVTALNRAKLTPAELAQLRALLSAARVRSRAQLQHEQPGKTLSPAALSALSKEWKSLWRTVVKKYPQTRAIVRELDAARSSVHRAHCG